MLATKVLGLRKHFKTDFVLVSNISENEEDKKQKRSIFLENLKRNGLKIETHTLKNSENVIFYLIYAPKRVLEKYAEILKMKMPLKSSYCESVKLTEKQEDVLGKLEKEAKESTLSFFSCIFGESSPIVEKMKSTFLSNLGKIEVFFIENDNKYYSMFV